MLLMFMDIVNNNNISTIVDNFIKEKGYKPEDFSETDDLLNNGILDSLDVINIILEIENTLGLNVNTENLNENINKKWFFNVN